MVLAPALLAATALEAAPDAMIVVDAGGIIRYANRQVGALFGYAPEEVIGLGVERLMPERFRRHDIGAGSRYMTDMRAHPMRQGLDLYGLRHDGTEFPVEISLSPINEQGEALIAASIRDGTHRKRTEGELLAARAGAERAREAADLANRAKSRFLATASHDLRQPLQTLALLNGTLRRTVLDEDAARALDQQEQAIAAMSRLLNALLDISKLESGAVKPAPEDFAVASLFEELRREFTEIATGKGLQFDVEPSPICVHSDPSLIGQVLRNLVANAIKYTRRGRVTLSCLASHDSMVRVEVLDTGIGIPADQLACIYDEFYQVGVATNTSREGYGLGLAIVKRIAELLELRLEVRSQPGAGSCFSLLLPPARGQPATPDRGSGNCGARRAIAETHDTLKVLLVEDDPAVRDATRMLLSVEGYQVTAVSSLAEALEASRAGIDLLVSDYHLRDGETGTQVIATLRQALGSPLKAVLVTGDTSTAVRELPRDLNLRIASKPLQAEELLRLLQSLMGADTPPRLAQAAASLETSEQPTP
jgi:PAS domain S-box-containing protein